MSARETGSTGLADRVSVMADLVADIADLLTRAGITDARAEARDLVAAVAGRSRFWPAVHADAPVDAGTMERAHAAAARRASGMPFAYAVGRAAFRHHTLSVDEHVLIPRQETEVLVDLVLGRRSGGVAADVGTGSGAIAIALATEGQFDRIIATDIAVDALSVAKRNAAAIATTITTPIEFRSGDLLTPLAGEQLDVLVSNPPYIAYEEARELPSSVRDWEPGLALFSGGEGLDLTRRIVAGAPALISSGGLLALEVDSRRAAQAMACVASSGAFSAVELVQDLMGRDRFVLATRV